VNSLASVRQTEKTARELNDLARSLSGIVMQYQLEEAESDVEEA
jgi:hypothetical protein